MNKQSECLKAKKEGLKLGRTSSAPPTSNFSRTPSLRQKELPNTKQYLKRTSSLRRTYSLGTPKRTIPQGPTLATEARSLARPCKCWKDGNFKGHLQSNEKHKGMEC